ncbi:hypothetical protein QVD17_23326 [Tagetes erecta]|uniref:RING-type domain-containing protein n=1 Tax=Tagetes erecta TaxID=13708 RepID=A0AAD8KGH9_TARER|nr:hypothetical protein QVD17_23326 [Tagetes erecta]
MKITIHADEPSSSTTVEPPYNTDRRVAYDVVFALIILLFILILIYATYMCNRIKDSESPPPPPTTIDSDTDNESVILSTNLEDDILSTFPTIVYSNAVTCDSRCIICLTDYDTMDVLRLLPECGHIFHVGCVDTWLKLHPTCPVCRKPPVPESTSELS